MATLLVTTVGIACLVLLALTLGRRIWTKVGALFILVAVTFHSVGELVTAIARDKNGYRRIIAQDEVDRWLLWVAPALLILTLSYLVTLGRRGQLCPTVAPRSVSRRADWRVLAATTGPLYLIALTSMRSSPLSAGAQSYFASGFASQYLQLGFVFTTYTYVVQSGRLLRGLFVQSLAMILLGQRSPVLFGILIVVALLARSGRRPTRRQVLGLITLGVFSSLLLSSSRATAGRTEFVGGSGLSARAKALVAGSAALARPAVFESLAADYIYRIDGNAYAAIVLRAQRSGAPTVGLAPVRNAVGLALPSFLSPGKLQSREETRSEKVYVGNAYNFDTRTTDYLPTLLGGIVAYYGPAGVLAAAAALGLLFGLLDLWLLGSSSARSIVFASVLLIVLYYETGFVIIPLTARGAILLVGAAKFVDVVKRAASRLRGRNGRVPALDVIPAFDSTRRATAGDRVP